MGYRFWTSPCGSMMWINCCCIKTTIPPARQCGILLCWIGGNPVISNPVVLVMSTGLTRAAIRPSLPRQIAHGHTNTPEARGATVCVEPASSWRFFSPPNFFFSFMLLSLHYALLILKGRGEKVEWAKISGPLCNSGNGFDIHAERQRYQFSFSYIVKYMYLCINCCQVLFVVNQRDATPYTAGKVDWMWRLRQYRYWLCTCWVNMELMCDRIRTQTL